MPSGDELDFLRWLEETDRPHAAVDVPLGDDGAVVRFGGESLVVAADAIAEGTHFVADADPELIGRKALAVNLSDLAAMGAEPVAAVVTAALPSGFDLSRAQAMTNGMRELGAAYDCPLVGGDTITRDGGVVLSVTAFGRPMSSRPVVRTGAQPGWVVMVTGAIGGSGKGRHLTFSPRIPEARCLVAATSRLAMIDVSDGLLLDLSRLTRGLGFRVDLERVPISDDADDPRSALEEGEDFELLLAVHPDDVSSIRSGWSLETPLSRIGVVTGSGAVLTVGGIDEAITPRGYRHG